MIPNDFDTVPTPEEEPLDQAEREKQFLEGEEGNDQCSWGDN